LPEVATVASGLFVPDISGEPPGASVVEGYCRAILRIVSVKTLTNRQWLVWQKRFQGYALGKLSDVAFFEQRP